MVLLRLFMLKVLYMLKNKEEVLLLLSNFLFMDERVMEFRDGFDGDLVVCVFFVIVF